MEAVVFDLDGVLVDSEKLWDDVRRSVVAEHGGTWEEEATRALQGMSTPEWADYLVTRLGTKLTPEQVAETVVERMTDNYSGRPPLLPDAEETVRAVAERHPVAIASSSPPVLINTFLDATNLSGLVPVAISSEQVRAGKPAPDVYLAAAARLGISPENCAAVEDSTNGLRAALAAGMTVIGVPNPHFPPDPSVLAKAAAVLDGVGELPSALAALEG
ncbi:HAD family hydrolase [Prauserella marina]|uniref:Haloacid dehalogenase superfamily, subfamily IA, variant 3 with third motif having DD or ED n=1 Tax=Prauserella marina TaxID=530584 RepID=A0A222VYK1_9PSEU|nr:HAD family phosphatase [Prauserella marina]ASR38763.1 HAD family hydrolase [Prauserella marina]PWV82118.1 HAD superfamily hydrolase (TIGR01509 family) [Prauserella marina]SDD19758.1 haloacid dehalogenase superfamily, subfamily IA, variant 3 with third motif having DD or ED [Prauserella marina]